MHRIHSAARRCGLEVAANSEEPAMPKRTSLPSMLPADLVFVSRLVDTLGDASAGFPPASRDVEPRGAEAEQDRHDRQQEPALPLILPYHPAEAVGQSRAKRNISIISARLVSGVGFSKGGGIGVEEPPPSPLRSLIASCLATGPRAMSCMHPRAWSPPTGPKVAAHPGRPGPSGYHADRQKHVERAAREVDPEVADVLASRRAKPRIRAITTAIPDAAERTMDGNARHLAQIAERRLAAIGLPAGVGRKAHSGVQREVRCECRKFLRIKRQPIWNRSMA